jgi:hypothetical protein
MIYDLFNPAPDTLIQQVRPMTANIMTDLSLVNGLSYIPEFISRQDHDYLWSTIYEQPWLNDLKRRVQHYGWKYDYKTRAIDYSMFLGELPDWAKSVAQRLYNEGLIPYKEYQHM